MFTGLVEAVGRVAALDRHDAGIHLRVDAPFAPDLRSGDSVAVNGVCLTVTGLGAGVFDADIGPETARRTTLPTLSAGVLVNLERALKAGDRFGGHFVQGHVDGIGTVTDLRGNGDARWLSVRYPGELAAFLISKGSIAVDGISLTVAAMREGLFDVMIIPYTWEHTALRRLAPGDRVNLECDMIGKYVARAMEVAAAAKTDSRTPDPG